MHGVHEAAGSSPVTPTTQKHRLPAVFFVSFDGIFLIVTLAYSPLSASINTMHLLHTTTWQDVFRGWHQREANNPGWIHCATQIKGWPDWTSWRSFTAEQFRASTLAWKVFAFDDPLQEIPSMLMGPYAGWQSRTQRKHETTFAQLLDIPGQEEAWSAHPGILAIREGLPFDTQFIGLISRKTGLITCLDGHHRATAFALEHRQGKILDCSTASITIALAEIPDTRNFDTLLARGTSKNP